nr:Mariner Mos1 transposase [Hymenolepis microstoma]CUU99735.1 Mariner Mos1 transposase [Hymenolepis microstoma]
MGISQQTISKRLKQLEVIKKEGYWVPNQELKPRRDVKRRLFACAAGGKANAKGISPSIVLLMETENGYITITLTLTQARAGNHGITRWSHCYVNTSTEYR